MVVWTDEERTTLEDLVPYLDNSVGEQALARCLIVYPWTMRYFGGFGNLYNAEAIKTNPKIKEHGATVMRGFEMGLKNLDTVKEEYRVLSTMHSEKLHIDPENFRLICDCVSIIVAGKMGYKFNSTVQLVLQKFLDVVCASLRQQY